LRRAGSLEGAVKINARHNDAQVYRFTPVRTHAQAESISTGRLDRRLLSSETSFFSELHHAISKMPNGKAGGIGGSQARLADDAIRNVTELQRVIDALLIEL
jgi:hypothetical protein